MMNDTAYERAEKACEEPEGEHFVSLANIYGKLYAATNKSVYRLDDNDRLYPLEIMSSEDDPETYSRLVDFWVIASHYLEQYSPPATSKETNSPLKSTA